jgi:tetratricopeptide (TPR) repeat protein
MSKKEEPTKNRITEIVDRLPDEERPVENNLLLRKFFIGGFLLIAALTFFLAMKTGINADEDFQVRYSESLVKWYATAGTDTTATNFTYRNAPMHYYGGFYEIIAGATNKVLGFTPDYLPYHDVRHIWVAIFGLLAMLFTSLAAREVAGWKAAIIALLLMAFSPYFMGNAVMNPKDIPFCTGFAMAIYFMIVYFREMPAPRKSTLIGLILAFAIALGTRAGGLLLIAYFGLFALVHVTRNYQLSKFFANRGLLLSYVRSAAAVIILGYLGAMLFWPFGLINPLKNPFKALAEFDKFSVGIKVLFGGMNVFSDKAPWSYAPESIFRTTPLVVCFGFALGVLFCWRLFKRFNPTAVFIGLFAAIFPVVYVIYKDSNMYNNWRHLLFIYPGVILTATLLYTYLYEFLTEKNKYLGMGLVVLLSVGIAMPAFHIVAHRSIPYIFYNNSVGGVQKAFGNYETDYWGISVREGAEYLEKQGVFNQNTGKPVLVATNMYYAATTYLNKKFGDKVKVIYVRYPGRYDQKWDYGLFTSIFVGGDQLRAGQWPMKSGTEYTVKVGDTPLLAVMKQDTMQRVWKAQQAMKQNNLPLATELLQQEAIEHPDNEAAWDNLASCQLTVNDFAAAQKSMESCLKISPENPTFLNMAGYISLNAGDVKGAINLLSKNIKKNPTDPQAFIYLAMAQMQSGDTGSALANVEKSIKINPTKDAYMLLAQIYDKMGNKAAAQQIMQQLR